MVPWSLESFLVGMISGITIFGILFVLVALTTKK